MNYVSSSSANGAIGYVEYSYALADNYPVAKMLNSAGYYTLPTQYDVAVALEKAQINMDKSSPDYLLQNLNKVYTDPDPRTYPLSSYVYMIEPTGKYPSPETKITNAKRQSIADFLYYSICQGQREIGPIGYSPLPVNLVAAGFGQIQKLKQAAPAIDLNERNIDTCDNPTFVEGHPNTNYLAQIAPMPPACDKVGAGPCAAGVTPNGTGPTPTTTIADTTTTTFGGGPTTTTTSGGGGPTTTTTSRTSAGRGSTTTTTSAGGGPTTTTTSATSAGGGPTTTTTGGVVTTNTSSGTGSGGSKTGTTVATSPGDGGSHTSVDPSTGQVVPGTSSGSSSADPQIMSATLASYGGSDLAGELAPIAAALLLLALVLPATIGYRLARKRREAEG